MQADISTSQQGDSDASPSPARAAVANSRDVPAEEILRIVHSRHDAPHQVLGPHFAEDRSAVVVRAFRPDAAQVSVVVSGPVAVPYPMRRIHADGLFEVSIADPAAPFDYELHVVDGDGAMHRCHDAYAVALSWFSDDDGARFAAGSHTRLFEKLGAHPVTRGAIHGYVFAVWAPAAERVSVVGTFNRWDGRLHPMRRIAASGVWEIVVPDVGETDLYKYEIKTAAGDVFLKADPFAFRTEAHPLSAGLVSDLDWGFTWLDADWMRKGRGRLARERAVAVCRIDLAAGGRADGAEPPLSSFRDVAAPAFLASVRDRGFTHIELSFAPPGAPGGSAGFFAPCPACGTPEELMDLIDACHQRDLGVILPTVSSRLPASLVELAWFDGTPLYEGRQAPAAGQPAALDIERGEIRSFMLSNARFWLDRYHADGWRSDVRGARLLRRLFELLPAATAGARVLVSAPPLGPALPAQDLSRLLRARHDDPYAILGPHLAEGALNIRTLQPEGEHVAATFNDEPEIVYEFAAVHDDGLFATTVPAIDAAAAYVLHVRERRGRCLITIDPYALQAFAFSDLDAHLFAAGNHYRIFEKLGAHPRSVDGIAGVGFAVWAPNAEGVSVVGPFNGWDGRYHALKRHGQSGVWEMFIPGLAAGELYKYEIRARHGHAFLKSDPYAFYGEVPPGSASIVYDMNVAYEWQDQVWRENRERRNPWQQPIAIYEVHLGSWLRGDDNRHLTYREIAAKLIAYVKRMGFTHIELLPIAEHPYEPSWGYQVSNFFAPTSRFGTPRDLMAFIDDCHRHDIGVILDWVPGHFPKDAHALAWFDGTHLYEHADPRRGEHRDWGTLIFNYGRHEVENFLIANALFWLEAFHFDGLRVDAVASMLYLDYSKPGPGDWIPNIYGGRENLEAIEFLKHVNAVVHDRFPGVLMIAEESTAWPKVSRPTDEGGLGFGFKWNMGWMHDVIAYMSTPAAERPQHHRKLTFGLVYAFDENFILSLSHDEVVHLKCSLLNKMPGDEWEKFANLRLLFSFMYAHPGKKLLFMGGEFGQEAEWNHATSLQWSLLEREPHRKLNRFFRDLNRLYRQERPLFETDFRGAGFEWLDVDNAEDSVVAFVRKAKDPRNALVFAMNFSTVSRPGYRFGVPYPSAYREIFNSNLDIYGGCSRGLRPAPLQADEIAWHGHAFSLHLPLPALSALVLKPAVPDLSQAGSGA